MAICENVDLAAVADLAEEALAARFIADAILCGLRNVTAQIVDPLPLKNAPSAPAFSAAATTRGRNGISLARNG